MRTILILALLQAAAVAEDLRLTLPPAIYATPGVEMNLYFANVVLVEREREGDLEFSVKCEVGKSDKARWQLLATESQVGDHRLTLEVKANGKTERAETIVRVIPGDAGAEDKIAVLIIGDSLTSGFAYSGEIGRLLGEPGNPGWQMLGTNRRADGVAHEGYGGWTWKRFRTLFNPENPEPGKLGSSPFVFDNKLDVARYFDERCDGVRPDFITILLGINDCFHPNPDDPAAIDARIDLMVAEAEPLLAAIRKAAPEAEIGIGLTTPGNVRDAAFVANYKDRYTRWGWRRIQHRVVEREIEQFGGREAEGIFLIPTQLNLDCDAGYPDNNGVHPNSIGYAQIGATIYSWLKWRLAEN
ncbi:MAG: lysophospholipase L1-like esterase [Verrucomicrobiales bacterium]|jgi:lysophospholipase L1-like esterase